MILPKSSSELKRLFETSSLPDIQRLHGEYLVDMLTVWPSFKKFSHRKVVYRKNGIVQGHNVLFNMVWGRFTLEEGICRDVDSGGAALINYDSHENSFPVRRIRDYIRCVEGGNLYIGRFYYRISDRLQFLGYFSLEKIK